MWHTLRNHYKGPLRAAILDWSGTVTDRYVIAPAVVFQKVFESKNVPISMEVTYGTNAITYGTHEIT